MAMVELLQQPRGVRQVNSKNKLRRSIAVFVSRAQKRHDLRSPQKKTANGEVLQNVSRAKQRTCLTHVAFICDRSDLQPLLPQVLIGNEATFKSREMGDLRAECPPNVR